jgi:predicted DNA-binding ribbon-helix-helix protein
MNQNVQEQEDQQPSRVIDSDAQFLGALLSKNVRIHDRRTSVRLEPEMWSALNEIARLEECSIHDLCGAVYDLKDPGTSFTAALRVFLMEYYRAAARASPQVSQIQKRVQGWIKNAQLKAAGG